MILIRIRGSSDDMLYTEHNKRHITVHIKARSIHRMFSAPQHRSFEYSTQETIRLKRLYRLQQNYKLV